MTATPNVPASSARMLPQALPSHGESIPDDEADSIRRIEDAIRAQVKAQAEADQVARRDAHVKAHATVRAQFQVLDTIPADYRHGIFARPAEFQAYVRFSNGNGAVRSDVVPDGRGMAIKVLGVDGSPSGTQDFLLINHPVFFVRNASDYVAFSTARKPLSFFANLRHPRFHEGLIAGAIALQRARSPLAYSYYSMTPFALGPHACKFAARPAGDIDPRPVPPGQDFMRQAVALHLAGTAATFDFLIQPRTDDSLPIEDPTIAWPETTAPFIRAARIVIPPQDFDTGALRELGENMSFTPWHAVPEHRPLGGINRVRRAIYDAISAFRHAYNHAERVEPPLPVP